MSGERGKTGYESWIAQEGVPVVEGYDVKDLRRVALGQWRRLGCAGAYIQLKGLEGITGVFVGELAPGAKSETERHLYEEVIYIVSGSGEAEIQTGGKPAGTVRWRAGSLFSPPLNASHRLLNTGGEAARFVAITTAPIVLDHFHNPRFVFDSDFVFSDRYDGEPAYFTPGENRYLADNNKQWIWETNFIPDLLEADIDPQDQKGAGVQLTQFELCGNTLIGHLAEWPVGCYHKAHHHGGGAVLVILRSEGYSLMWPSEWGPRPYANGYGERVVRVDWLPQSIFSPPTGWFHQHFNTGREPALQLALRCGSQKHPLGIRVAAMRAGVYTSMKDGGTLIEYEDEDPAMRRMYLAELKAKGVACAMPGSSPHDRG
ncbi:MAG TPA: cupin domain-containing protein [Candidatus Binatia bacterium]